MHPKKQPLPNTPKNGAQWCPSVVLGGPWDPLGRSQPSKNTKNTQEYCDFQEVVFLSSGPLKALIWARLVPFKLKSSHFGGKFGLLFSSETTLGGSFLATCGHSGPHMVKRCPTCPHFTQKYPPTPPNRGQNLTENNNLIHNKVHSPA